MNILNNLKDYFKDMFKEEPTEDDIKFLVGYERAIKAFVRSHQGYRPPFFRDPITLKFRWINRAERRKNKTKLGY